MNEIKVNDGGGLFDSTGLIDTLIVDCNTLPKFLFEGQYVGFCAKVVEMVQKLSNLKKGVKNDMDSVLKQVETLTQENENLCSQLFQTEKGES